MVENIELDKDSKIKLKHMAIDKDTTLNKWMEKGAQYVLDNNIDIEETEVGDYTTYTMEIPIELKEGIRAYTKEKEVRLRDFWATVSNIIIENGGL